MKIWKTITFPLLLLTLTFSIQVPASSKTLGGKCSKNDQFKLIKKTVAVCTKTGNKYMWVKATPKQAKQFQKIKLAELINSRKAKVSALLILRKELDSSETQTFPLNVALIEIKKNAVEEKRKGILSLELSLNSEKSNNSNLINTLTGIEKSLIDVQNRSNSTQSQINSQQSVVNISKANNDATYRLYISAKSQSDSLYYSYQRAVDDNSAMLSAKVLCDFGFGYCGIYNSFQYSLNASTISRYNSAVAATSSAYSTWVNYNSKYTSDLSVLNTLKNQLNEVSNSLTKLTSQRNSTRQSLENSSSNVNSLTAQLKTSQNDFVKFQQAEVRISSDSFTYYETLNKYQNKRVELSETIQMLIDLATEEFIASASTQVWDPKLMAIDSLKVELDQLSQTLKTISSDLTTFLGSLN